MERPVTMVDFDNKLVYCHLTDEPEEGDPHEFGFEEVVFDYESQEKLMRVSTQVEGITKSLEKALAKVDKLLQKRDDPV